MKATSPTNGCCYLLFNYSLRSKKTLHLRSISLGVDQGWICCKFKKNRHRPSIHNLNYNFSVLEGAPVDTAVFPVSAIDADEGPNGQVTYTLHSENEAHTYLKINPQTGLVQVRNTDALLFHSSEL